MPEDILSRMLFFWKRDLQKIIDDIEIQLVLLKKELYHLDQKSPALLATIRQALDSCGKEKTDILHKNISQVTKEIRRHRPLEHCEHYALNLDLLNEELGKYSVNNLVQKSESQIEFLFNNMKKYLQDIKKCSEGRYHQIISPPLFELLTKTEDSLLDGFSRSDESKVLQLLSACATPIDRLNLELLSEKNPRIQELRLKLIESWNSLMDIIIGAFQKVHAKAIVYHKTGSGVTEIVTSD